MTANRSKVQDLKARRTNAEATDAIRLQTALQRKRCRHCGQSGTAWAVYKTDGEIRYLKCRGCGRTDKLVVGRSAQSGSGKVEAAPVTGADGAEFNGKKV